MRAKRAGSCGSSSPEPDDDEDGAAQDEAQWPQYECKYPGCSRQYASTDGVRKHCRKHHTEWLKALDADFAAGLRCASRAEMYCTRVGGDERASKLPRLRGPNQPAFFSGQDEGGLRDEREPPHVDVLLHPAARGTTPLCEFVAARPLFSFSCFSMPPVKRGASLAEEATPPLRPLEASACFDTPPVKVGAPPTDVEGGAALVSDFELEPAALSRVRGAGRVIAEAELAHSPAEEDGPWLLPPSASKSQSNFLELVWA